MCETIKGNETLKFSVIMSIYKNDNPEYLRIALNSIINQTLVPDEIVLIADGPVPESLHSVVDDAKAEFPNLNPYYQDENAGLGAALRIAVDKAKYDYLRLNYYITDGMFKL